MVAVNFELLQLCCKVDGSLQGKSMKVNPQSHRKMSVEHLIHHARMPPDNSHALAKQQHAAITHSVA